MQKNKYKSSKNSENSFHPQEHLQDLLHFYKIDAEFPEFLRKSSKIPSIETLMQQSYRVDLRHLRSFTIDGADAKDLDDALSYELFPTWWSRLGIHIADVSEYVLEGSACDAEAFRRGTSIYPSGTVIPMLPEYLSNEACSLHPGSPKATVSVFCTFNNQYECIDVDFQISLIQSQARLTYDMVQDLFDGKQSPVISDPLQKDILALRSCIASLQKKALQQGKIEFVSREKKILWSQGRPKEIVFIQQNEAHKYIETAMILANECVAHHLQKIGYPCISRNHASPRAEKFEKLQTLCKDFQIQPPKGAKNTELALLLGHLKSTDPNLYALFSPRVLECMEKAVYEDVSRGHYGLALRYYGHFTSPIRRYADLVNHRMIKRWIISRKAHYALPTKITKKIASQCSETEIRAATVEFAYFDRLAGDMMFEKIGEIFPAIIAGDFGQLYFCELENGISVASYVPWKSAVRRVAKRGLPVDIRIEWIDARGRIEGKILLRK
jgi:ribonuclease R